MRLLLSIPLLLIGCDSTPPPSLPVHPEPAPVVELETTYAEATELVVNEKRLFTDLVMQLDNATKGYEEGKKSLESKLDREIADQRRNVTNLKLWKSKNDRTIKDADLAREEQQLADMISQKPITLEDYRKMHEPDILALKQKAIDQQLAIQRAEELRDSLKISQ